MPSCQASVATSLLRLGFLLRTDRNVNKQLFRNKTKETENTANEFVALELTNKDPISLP